MAGTVSKTPAGFTNLGHFADIRNPDEVGLTIVASKKAVAFVSGDYFGRGPTALTFDEARKVRDALSLYLAEMDGIVEGDPS